MKLNLKSMEELDKIVRDRQAHPALREMALIELNNREKRFHKLAQSCTGFNEFNYATS